MVRNPAFYHLSQTVLHLSYDTFGYLIFYEVYIYPVTGLGAQGYLTGHYTNPLG